MNQTDSADLRNLLAADDVRLSALVANDLEGLKAVLHPDLIYVHTNGSRDSRDSLLSSLRERRLIYRKCEHVDRIGVVAGATGVIQGSLGFEVLLDGNPRRLDIRYQSVWVIEGERRRMIGWLSCLR